MINTAHRPCNPQTESSRSQDGSPCLHQPPLLARHSDWVWVCTSSSWSGGFRQSFVQQSVCIRGRLSWKAPALALAWSNQVLCSHRADTHTSHPTAVINTRRISDDIGLMEACSMGQVLMQGYPCQERRGLARCISDAYAFVPQPPVLQRAFF